MSAGGSSGVLVLGMGPYWWRCQRCGEESRSYSFMIQAAVAAGFHHGHCQAEASR